MQQNARYIYNRIFWLKRFRTHFLLTHTLEVSDFGFMLSAIDGELRRTKIQFPKVYDAAMQTRVAGVR